MRIIHPSIRQTAQTCSGFRHRKDLLFSLGILSFALFILFAGGVFAGEPVSNGWTADPGTEEAAAAASVSTADNEGNPFTAIRSGESPFLQLTIRSERNSSLSVSQKLHNLLAELLSEAAANRRFRDSFPASGLSQTFLFQICLKSSLPVRAGPLGLQA